MQFVAIVEAKALCFPKFHREICTPKVLSLWGTPPFFPLCVSLQLGYTTKTTKTHHLNTSEALTHSLSLSLSLYLSLPFPYSTHSLLPLSLFFPVLDHTIISSLFLSPFLHTHVHALFTHLPLPLRLCEVNEGV